MNDESIIEILIGFFTPRRDLLEAIDLYLHLSLQ
jgi:hypothetical protein